MAVSSSTGDPVQELCRADYMPVTLSSPPPKDVLYCLLLSGIWNGEPAPLTPPVTVTVTIITMNITTTALSSALSTTGTMPFLYACPHHQHPRQPSCCYLSPSLSPRHHCSQSYCVLIPPTASACTSAAASVVSTSSSAPSTSAASTASSASAASTMPDASACLGCGRHYHVCCWAFSQRPWVKGWPST